MDNKITYLFALFFSLAAPVLAADGGRSDWTGLWRLTQQTSTGPVQMHLHIPDGSGPPSLYGTRWERLPLSESKIEAETLFLNWLVKGFNVAFEGQRKLDRVTGHWQLVHPQYAQSGEFSAERLFPNPQWAPLDGFKSLGSPSTLVDLNAYLLEKSSSQDDFAGFWEKNFYSDFYVFLGDAPSASRVRRLLKQPHFPKRAEAFAAQYKELVDAVRKNLPGMSLSIPVVALPFGEAEPRIVWIDKMPFLVVNADRFGQQAQESRRRAYFAERMMDANFRWVLPRTRAMVVDLWKQGIPAFFAVKTGFAAPHEILDISSERFSELESNVVELKQKQKAGNPLSKQELNFLAYDFVASVAADKTAPDLIALKAVQIAQAFDRYLGA